MKRVFYSASTQEHNTGPNRYVEEKAMNLIVDDCEKISEQSYGLKVYRNNPDKSLGDSTRLSNSLGVDCHVAIHSNAGGGRGCEIYCNQKGSKLAQIVYKKMEKLTPTADRGIKGDGDLYETNNIVAPNILIEVDFHDSIGGVEFILKNTREIAKVLADSVAEFLEVDLLDSKFKELKLGSKGPRVKKLQERLVYHGFDIEVTSIFDKATEAAVEQFQKNWHLDIKRYKIVGQKTWNALMK